MGSFEQRGCTAKYILHRRVSLLFYSDEESEPAHVHIDAGNNAAKLWLNTGELARSCGFKGHELAILRKLVMQHKDELLEAWNVHFTRTI